MKGNVCALACAIALPPSQAQPLMVNSISSLSLYNVRAPLRTGELYSGSNPGQIFPAPFRGKLRLCHVQRSLKALLTRPPATQNRARPESSKARGRGSRNDLASYVRRARPYPTPCDESVISSRNSARHPSDGVRGQYLNCSRAALETYVCG